MHIPLRISEPCVGIGSLHDALEDFGISHVPADIYDVIPGVGTCVSNKFKVGHNKLCLGPKGGRRWKEQAPYQNWGPSFDVQAVKLAHRMSCISDVGWVCKAAAALICPDRDVSQMSFPTGETTRRNMVKLDGLTLLESGKDVLETSRNEVVGFTSDQGHEAGILDVAFGENSHVLAHLHIFWNAVEECLCELDVWSEYEVSLRAVCKLMGTIMSIKVLSGYSNVRYIVSNYWTILCTLCNIFLKNDYRFISYLGIILSKFDYIC